MANYDHFLHANTALNWLPRSIMCVGPRKSKFWTRCIRFSIWKPPVNIFFAQEIVWKSSVILLLCLSHLWKLLVPLSWPFFSIYNSNDKLEQRHLVCVFNKNHNAPTLTMLFIIIISFSQNWGTVPQFCEKAPPLKNGQFWGQKRPENAPNFFHGFLTYTKFTFCKKNGPNRPILSSAVIRIIYCRL